MPRDRAEKLIAENDTSEAVAAADALRPRRLPVTGAAEWL
jgi:hypothetical protein